MLVIDPSVPRAPQACAAGIGAGAVGVAGVDDPPQAVTVSKASAAAAIVRFILIPL
ncbi:MAG: hypothetical protein H0X44_03175 [Acidobacteria bacterium]|nr:hypothetical protein [Acidobacteriota bacterium]